MNRMVTREAEDPKTERLVLGKANLGLPKNALET